MIASQNQQIGGLQAQLRALGEHFVQQEIQQQHEHQEKLSK